MGREREAGGFTLAVGTWADTHIYAVGSHWIAVGQVRLGAQNASGLAALGNNSAGPALIPAEARQAALTPLIDAVSSAAGGGLQFGFNTIPGRVYEVQASTDLVNWTPLGSATATDFNLLLATGDNLSYAQRFFRIQTP